MLCCESQRLAQPELMMNSTWRPKGAKFRKKKQTVRMKTKSKIPKAANAKNRRNAIGSARADKQH
ncbi:hypothetical protein [Candidatus Enterococcus mansonii]|uniref:hypothetical protein n=1 Tax=Candidatus Enterococcus mansonii TaxID=1834181 RepID=UPI000A34A959|nr:hypothetical protein [Enterococcus sp. 4G2_DIV0659]